MFRHYRVILRQLVMNTLPSYTNVSNTAVGNTYLLTPWCATCPAHLILLDFITRTILGEQYKSFSSSLCNLLHSAVTSSLLGPNILLNTMFCSQTPSASFRPAMSTTKLHTHTKQPAKLQFCISWSLNFWIATWKTKDSAPNDSKQQLSVIQFTIMKFHVSFMYVIIL